MSSYHNNGMWYRIMIMMPLAFQAIVNKAVVVTGEIDLINSKDQDWKIWGIEHYWAINASSRWKDISHEAAPIHIDY